MQKRSILLWVAALILVLFAAVYQRLTGPSYPVRGETEVSHTPITFRLPRSHGGSGPAEVRIKVPDTELMGTIRLRRFRSDDAWLDQSMERQSDSLIAYIPHQPPAGKVMYQILLRGEVGEAVPLTSEPVIIRFRADVPIAILYPHIFLMFLAMLVSTRSGLEAISKGPGVYRFSLWTTVFLVLGGLVLGPVVQKFAFGAFWTGWPFGHDLTDNKTIAAAAAWIVALWRLRKDRTAVGWAIAAAVILFAVYMIPHSVLGSELDYRQIEGQSPK
jgi:hypothetical protein